MSEPLFFHNGSPIKPFGFGCMRLPVVAEGEIDLPQMEKMVSCFLERGFCYFDTAYGYHKQRSEPALREALTSVYQRSRYVLATKLPAWKHFVHEADDAKRMFYTQIERLGVDSFDYYLFQNMGEKRTEAFDRFHLWDFIADQKRQGTIMHFGVSFHDKADKLDSLLLAHPEIEYVQLQLNYADWESPIIEARKCWETALRHQKPIIVMEPIKGGNLITPPQKVKDVLERSSVKQCYADWALRFAANLPGVKMVLSGVSNETQMQENTSLFDRMSPLTSEERDTITRAIRAFSEVDGQLLCTGCRYCTEECPGGVEIPKIMTALNFVRIYGNQHAAEHYYFSNLFLSGKASGCLECGSCEKACPQHLPIISLLKEAKNLFGE